MSKRNGLLLGVILVHCCIFAYLFFGLREWNIGVNPHSNGIRGDRVMVKFTSAVEILTTGGYASALPMQTPEREMGQSALPLTETNEIYGNKGLENSPEQQMRTEAKPIRLTIPRLKIDCAVEMVGHDSNWKMETISSGAIASWYREGARPGGSGNTIIAAHNKWAKKPAAFFQLYKIQDGDLCEIIMDDGTIVLYETESVEVYERDKVPASVMDTGGKNRLTLITCHGEFDESTGSSKERVIALFRPSRVIDPSANRGV